MNGENRRNYGWIIVAVSTFALVVSNGLSTTGIPVFYKPIREEFIRLGAVETAYAESFIATGANLTFLMSGVFSLIGGWLALKFKLRNLMIFGCVLLGGGLLIHSLTVSPNLVYLSRFLMGASLGFVGVAPNVVLVSNWFGRFRGTALGVVLTGTSFGGVFVPPIAAPLISAYGWRTAMMSVSLLVWLVLLPAIFFLVKDKPEDLNADRGMRNAESETENQKPKTENQTEGLTLGEAVKTFRFWIFGLCAALVFYPIFVTSQQFILYLQTPKIGLSLQQAGLMQSALFAVSVGGKFLFGFLSDRFAPTRVMFVCCSVMFLATLVLLALTANTAFWFLIPFGLGYGGTFVLLQRLTADYFGMREYGKILGAITIIEVTGAAIGGRVTGKLADASGGDYTNAFYGVIVATALAFLCVVALNFLYSGKDAGD